MNRLLKLALIALVALSLMAAGTAPAQAQQAPSISVSINGCTVVVAVEALILAAPPPQVTSFSLFIYNAEGDEIYNENQDYFFDPITFVATFTPPLVGTINVIVFENPIETEWLSADYQINCTADTPVVGVPCVGFTGAGQGLLVRATPIYWAPRANAASNIILDTAPNAKTYWVLGVDSTRSFYKIIIACKTYWVPIDSLVPNPDAVWRGAPLPTRVVED
jgi:hypothetical protein